MRLAITGATGLLGKYFIDKYKHCYDIVALTRSEDNQLFCKVKVTDYSFNSLKEILKDCDAILHLSAGRPNNTKTEKIIDNVKLDSTLFLVAKALSIKNIVFCSSRGVYGQQQIPWHEQMDTFPENLYALAKVQSELSAKYYNTYYDMCIKILRISQVYSKDEYKGSMIRTFLDNALENKKIQITVTGIDREYTYIDDIAEAFNLALQKKYTKGIFNVGSGELISIKEIAEYIQNAFGRDNLLEYEETSKVILEKNLMDSTLFQKEFNWKVKYNFKNASIEIAKKMGIKE